MNNSSKQGNIMKNNFSLTVKKQRGRPRIAGKLREPSGRISRAKDPAQKVALAARAKAYNLTLEQAASPYAQSYLGRLLLFGNAGGLCQKQYDAAQIFLKIRNDYRRSILSPGAYYEATGIRLGQENMEEYTAWVIRARKRYSSALKAIQEAQFDNSGENLYAAIQYVIIDDRELPHLLGATRMVLNALLRHFHRVEPKTKKNIWGNHISLMQINTLEQKSSDELSSKPSPRHLN